MSDADDQLGGTGGKHGQPPAQATPGKDNAAPPSPPQEDDGDLEQSKESFPASDPPANY